MLISLEILKKYIDIPKNISPKDIALRLTEKVVEVEKVIDKSKELKNIYVGKVEKIIKHPNADKLKLAEVSILEKRVKVVCGGTNLEEGMATAVALPGAKIRWHGEGDLIELAKAEIRGEKSEGMICAADEIGLYEMFPHEQMEIMDLSDLNLRQGANLADALGLNDKVLDIDNKSITNRPDLWSHWGMARELSAILNIPLKGLDIYEKSEIKADKQIDIKIDDYKLCSRYLGCVIENLKIEESPDWLKKALASVGQKSINNIVDITNYVMFEVGEPLHAFDKDKIDSITVRLAQKGENIITLDEEVRALDEGDLVVADSKGPQALAGLKGGLESGVGAKTKSIILEAANFDALTIRRMTMKHAFRTEGSNRWEKSLHANLAEVGMRRALQLILEVCPGAKISPTIIEDKKIDSKPNIIDVNIDFIQTKIGKKISRKEIINTLEKLGFEVSGDDYLKVEVPWWRSTGDISIPEDIVEEVARIYGYDNLEVSQELVDFEAAKYQPKYDEENKVKNYLSLGAGMVEVFNYPWAEIKILEKLNTANDKYVEIANPPTEDNRFLKTSLLSGLIKNVEDNLRFSSNFKLFELARVYIPGNEKFDGDDKLPKQTKMLSGAVVGDRKSDVFNEIKGIVEGLSKEFDEAKIEFLDEGKSLEIMYNKEKIGWLGELKDEYYVKFDFNKKKVAFFEIDFDSFIKIKLAENKKIKYEKLSQYPIIERDIAIEVENEVKWIQVVESLEGFDKLIDNIKFLSIYDLKNGKKSLAFRVVYRSDEKTLTDNQVINIENGIIKMLRTKFNAELRG